MFFFCLFVFGFFAEHFENGIFSHPSYPHSFEEELGGIFKGAGNFLTVFSWNPDGPSRQWTRSRLLLTWELGSFPLRLLSIQTLLSTHLRLTFTRDKHLNWKSTSSPFLYIKHQGFLPSPGIQNQQARFSHSPTVSCPYHFPKWPKPRSLFPLAL